VSSRRTGLKPEWLTNYEQLLRVESRVQLPGGTSTIGVAFELSQGRKRASGARDWNVQERHPDGSIRRGTVHQHLASGEPKLCLVARAAWTLWNDDMPMVETGKYVGLEVVVKNNTSLIAMISLDVGRTGTEAKGYCYETRSALAMRSLDSMRAHDVGHWTRLTLCEMAFGEVAPPPRLPRQSAPRLLPTFWSRDPTLNNS
jgi:hypothetical protein